MSDLVELAHTGACPGIALTRAQTRFAWTRAPASTWTTRSRRRAASSRCVGARRARGTEEGAPAIAYQRKVYRCGPGRGPGGGGRVAVRARVQAQDDAADAPMLEAAQQLLAELGFAAPVAPSGAAPSAAAVASSTGTSEAPVSMRASTEDEPGQLVDGGGDGTSGQGEPLSRRSIMESEVQRARVDSSKRQYVIDEITQFRERAVQLVRGATAMRVGAQGRARLGGAGCASDPFRAAPPPWPRDLRPAGPLHGREGARTPARAAARAGAGSSTCAHGRRR